MGDGRGVLYEESADGGSDVRSSSNSAEARADHLVVMVHGILGSDDNWKFAADQFVGQFPDKVIVHRSERNKSKLTLDGVDVMGERLAEEVIEVIGRWSGLQKISFIAHSVGGLVARYAIGRLYRHPTKQMELGSCECRELSRGTIYGLEAINFITVATPHLGSRGNRQVPFLRGWSALEKTASYVIHWILRRTGRHLFLTDSDDGKPPLLHRMVTDIGDISFISALRSFKRRVAYSNACYDHVVGWSTSSIRRSSELPQWANSLNEKYPHVVHEEYSKEESSDEGGESPGVSVCLDKIEEELVVGLRKVSWEKVDVSFHNSKHRDAAHCIIQVTDALSHSEGADVIQHMIDQFVA